MDAERRITSLDSVPDDGTFLFTVDDVEDDERKEAILARLDDGVAGWLNYCQHYTHIKLDKGSGAPRRDDELICANHGAYFEVDTGYCTFGPCEGAYLTRVTVAVEDGDVYLTDPDYEFVREGPMETDPTDLASRSNLEF